MKTKVFIIKKSSYKTLFRDHETDILFHGKNQYGDIILGSIMDEDNDAKIYKHLHSIISSNDLESLISGKSTYLSILKNAIQIYLIETKYSGEISAKAIKFDDIPKEYLGVVQKVLWGGEVNHQNQHNFVF